MENPIKSHLEASGKTQRDLANALGVREATVSAWANGKIPRAEQMQRIEEVTAGAIPVTAWFAWIKSQRAPA